MDASQSPSVDGGEVDDEPQTGGAKPGRKKGPANQAARRDQNRIAQREFRLRKQQRIRDLEARVEILSGTKEETHSHTRVIIQGLMEENAKLRALVRDLGGFMADGLGGPLLDRTGWTMHQFREFINRADSDTAYESFVKAKAATKSMSADVSSSAMHHSQTTPEQVPARKRKRDSLEANDSTTAPVDLSGPPSSMRRAYSASTGRNPPLRGDSPEDPLPGLLPTGTPFRTDRHDLSDVPSSFTSLVDTLNTSAAAPFVALTSSRSTLRPGPTPPAPGYSQDSGFTMNYNGNAVDSPAPAIDPEARRAQIFAENEPKRDEAGKLIKYHLDNYRRNENYFLPASLRPTLVQRTIVHEPLVDGVIYPEVRDRMILLKDQYDLAQCLTDFLRTIIIHGDDVLAHTNWEVGEQWLRTYGFLVEESVLASCNKWRRARGDQELMMADLNPLDQQGQTPSSIGQ